MMCCLLVFGFLSDETQPRAMEQAQEFGKLERDGLMNASFENQEAEFLSRALCRLVTFTLISEVDDQQSPTEIEKKKWKQLRVEKSKNVNLK